jgi:hypothetical protein
MRGHLLEKAADMNIANFLESLAEAGVSVCCTPDGQLEVRPASRLTIAMRTAIRENKPALIAHLTQQEAIATAEMLDELPPSLAAEALLGRLKRLGYSVAVDEHVQLEISGKQLTDELRQSIRKYKLELLGLCCAGEVDDYAQQERLAIQWSDTPDADASLRQQLTQIDQAGGMDKWFESLESPTSEFFADCDRDRHDWIKRCRRCGKIQPGDNGNANGYKTGEPSPELPSGNGSNQQPLFAKG